MRGLGLSLAPSQHLGAEMIEKRAPLVRPKVVSAIKNESGRLKSVTYGNSVFRQSGTKTIHEGQGEKYIVRGGGSLTRKGKAALATAGVGAGAVATEKVKKGMGSLGGLRRPLTEMYGRDYRVYAHHGGTWALKPKKTTYAELTNGGYNKATTGGGLTRKGKVALVAGGGAAGAAATKKVKKNMSISAFGVDHA